MRTFAAVTTFNLSGYEVYGRNMIASFHRHWPAQVPLYVYAEDCHPELPGARIIERDLLQSSPELVAFKERYKDNAEAKGESPRPYHSVRFKFGWPWIKIRRKHNQGYRWNAVRFSHKMFAIFHAAANTDADILFWLDGDLLFFADLPDAFLESMVPADRLLGMLRRPGFTECGFVAYNLRHPAMQDFLEQFRLMYTDDRFWDEKEYHDSFLCDRVRERFEKQGHQFHDIGEGIGYEHGHVLINSPLGQYMDHVKGRRKSEGASFRDDLKVERTEAYWQQQKRDQPLDKN